MSASLIIPRCRYCSAPLMQLREHGSWGPVYMVNRDSGERHQCKRIWAGIDTALAHPSGGCARPRVQLTVGLRLLSMLRQGPVLQSELYAAFQSSALYALTNLRRTVLAESGLVVAARWCCPLAPRYPHARERVYQLERPSPAIP